MARTVDRLLPGQPGDILDPRSRHNIHVTRADDLDVVGEWARDTLYAAVRRAEREERVVVLDYGRSALYLADGADLSYEPPRRLGFAAPPMLHVGAPWRFQPDQHTTTAVDAVTVSPEFDILVPAFDWADLSEEDVLPPIDARRSRTPAGSGTGTPG
jgi:hypothetical protein